MNNKKLFSYAIMSIGLVMILLGARWMLVEAPWMLDEVANVERLGMEFNELFEPETNNALPGYLRQIYRFFGYWVIVIGLFIVSFSTLDIIENSRIRQRMLMCLGFMMTLGTILGYTLIPSSHFIYLIWIMNAVFAFCVYSHKKIAD